MNSLLSNHNFNGLRLLISFVSLLITFYVAFSPVVIEGLEFLFLLPLVFCSCIVLFYKEFSYMKTSYGLTIIYLTVFVRYIITPILMSASQSVVPTISAHKTDYFNAIIIQVFELYALLIAIKFIWPKYFVKKKSSNIDFKKYDFKLSWSGLLFLILLIVLLFGRGHFNNVISHLSTWTVRQENHEILYSYDMMAFNILKTALFLFVVSLMKRLYINSQFRILPVLISLLAGILNTMFFEYTERTDLIILFLATFFVLTYSFPNDKKLFYLIFGIGGVLFVALVFMEGTMSYNVGNTISSIDIKKFQIMSQLYTTGPSVVANALMNFESTKTQMSTMTYFKDIATSFDFCYTLPFLRFIGDSVENYYSTTELFVNSIGGLSYILPNYSLSCLYAGEVFGWIVEIFFIIFTIKLIGYFECKILDSNDTSKLYAIINLVTMFSMGIFCNNFHLMLHAATGLPFWLFVFSIVNSFGNRFGLTSKGLMFYGKKCN